MSTLITIRLWGGTKSATLKYEVDYWLTCYKELTNHVMMEEDSPQTIYVAFTPDIVSPYVDPEDTVLRVDDIRYPDGSLVFLPLRWDYLLLYPEYSIVQEVKLNGLNLCAARLVTPLEESD